MSKKNKKGQQIRYDLENCCTFVVQKNFLTKGKYRNYHIWQ